MLWKDMRITNPQFSSFEQDLGFPSEDYEFEIENPYLEIEFPYEEGLNLLKKGNLVASVLAFEAAVQRDKENSDLWFKLGIAQAENEKEQVAIIALKKALQYNPDHLAVWMVSFLYFILLFIV
jgi:peroxin-5